LFAPGAADAEGDDEAVAAAFERSYAVGAQLLSAAGGRLPASLDAAIAGGHLMRVCLEHRRLSSVPAREPGGSRNDSASTAPALSRGVLPAACSGASLSESSGRIGVLVNRGAVGRLHARRHGKARAAI
jgi:hypothetical protein